MSAIPGPASTFSSTATGAGFVPARYGDEAFRRLVESVRDYAIFMLDSAGRVISWNPGAQHIKGYAADEIIGKHFSIFYTQDALDSGWPEEELRRALQAGRFEDEGWRLRKDGSRFWANVIIAPMRGSDGELLGFSKVTRDLTERRRHQQKLQESEESFRLLVESVRGHAIFLLDEAGRVCSWNAGAQRVLGFSEEEVLGRGTAIFHPAEAVVIGTPQAELGVARDTGFFENMGWRVRSDGAALWTHATLTSLFRADGRFRGFVQVIRDMSERRRVHELEAESRRITEFIAMLSHELRNPLAPILNAVGILKRSRDTGEVERSAAIIERQVGHLARLVDDLLDVSRITSGKIQLRSDIVELGAVVQAAADSIRPAADARGHTLDVRSFSEAVFVRGDATRLTQVVVNLLTNAVKYTPAGGYLRLELVPQTSVATMRVVDDGVGMSPALMASAFDLFAQGDRALDRSEGGLGIGLTLVRSIVAMHGGTVSVTSPGPGQGSEFEVSLPRVAQPADTAPVANPPTAPRAARSILVVDDNQDAANTLAALLEMSGYAVQVAHDGQKALGIAASNPFDAVLLDLGLPAMDGYEVARRLRQLPSFADTRLIALTGYGRDSDRRAAIEAGFQAHLVKPVEFDELARVIDGQA